MHQCTLFTNINVITFSLFFQLTYHAFLYKLKNLHVKIMIGLLYQLYKTTPIFKSGVFDFKVVLYVGIFFLQYRKLFLVACFIFMQIVTFC